MEVGVKVAVLVGVNVAVFVTVLVGVLVGVPVFVMVAVFVGVPVIGAGGGVGLPIAVTPVAKI